MVSEKPRLEREMARMWADVSMLWCVGNLAINGIMIDTLDEKTALDCLVQSVVIIVVNPF